MIYLTISLIFAFGPLSQISFVSGEVVLQDVLWTKNYELDENYFGTCRFVESPCGYYYGQGPNIKDGVCVKSQTCIHNGGYPIQAGETCFGECCVFRESCYAGKTDIHVNQLVTTLDSNSGRCTYKFRKEPEICQIRLDFVQIHTESANADGICEIDKIRISNSITVDNDFTTCGRNLAGQHLYLAFGSNEEIQIFSEMKSPGAHYSIIATKIPCHSRSRVPDHCLQYFHETSGQIRSLDFGRQQQSNQRYTVCVKPEAETSKIIWKTCGSGNLNHSSFDIISNFEGIITGDACTTDWVQVKGSPKQCDGFTPQTSSWKPYELMVNFDHQEIPPPPPHTIVPVDPQNCESQCANYNNLPNYECACVQGGNNNSTGEEACMCLQVMPNPPLKLPMAPDLANVGFCLEYNQI